MSRCSKKRMVEAKSPVGGRGDAKGELVKGVGCLHGHRDRLYKRDVGFGESAIMAGDPDCS